MTFFFGSEQLNQHAMPTYDKSLPKLNKRGGGRGRPAKRTKELEKTLLAAIADGAPYVVACGCVGISPETFFDWRRRDPEFNDLIEKTTAQCTMRRVRKIERHGEENFAALSWLLERLHPSIFSKPEIQLSVTQQNTTVENSLTINITGVEASAIESEAQPVRDAVSSMFAKYKPIGNGEGRIHDIEASPVMSEPPPITHLESDAQNPLFWKRLVTSRPESKVARQTAEFAARALLLQTLGYKARRLEVTFRDDPVTVEDMFALVEKLGSGPAGWQRAQQLGGFT